MTIDLYYVPVSPPCRSIMLLAKHIHVDLNLKYIDLMGGEHLKPEFLAINPAHSVPTIVDHETKLTLWESRAILGYLVDKYAPGNNMYPQDPVKRALVDRWLYFDCGSLFPSFLAAFRPMFFSGAEKPEQAAMDAVNDKLKLFDTLIERQETDFLAGDHVTIADLALAVSLDMPVHFVSLDLSKFPNVDSWYKGVKETVDGYYEICDKPLEEFKIKFDEMRAAKMAQK